MKNKNQKGQSTIEFLLTFIVALGFVFLFLKMALNYTNGYMVHHATYMASRAYLVNDAERQTPAENDKRAFEFAKTVFARYLPEGLIPGFDGVLKENSPDSVKFSVFSGVWIDFKQAFSLGILGGKDPVEFRSESFLGREPSRSESYHQECEAIKSVGSLSKCNIQATLDDNGG